MLKKMFSVIILGLFLAALIVPVVFAAVNAQSAGTNLGVVERVNFSTGLTATKSGSTVTVVPSGTQVVTGGTINGAVIGGTSPAAGSFTTLDVSTSASMDGITVNWTDLKLISSTGINWQDATIVGDATIADAEFTSIDVNGGTIDAATIGATTPAAVTGTVLTAITGINWVDAALFAQAYSGINWTDAHHICFDDAGVPSSDADGTCP